MNFIYRRVKQNLLVFQIGNFFRKFRLPVVTIYNAAFDTSSATPLLMKVGERGRSTPMSEQRLWLTEKAHSRVQQELVQKSPFPSPPAPAPDEFFIAVAEVAKLILVMIRE